MSANAVFLLVSQSGVDSLGPALNEQIYRAAANVLLCLSEPMDSGVDPPDGSQLRQLQQEVTALFSFTLKRVFTLLEMKPLCSVFSHGAEDAVGAARRRPVGDATRNIEGTSAG